MHDYWTLLLTGGTVAIAIHIILTFFFMELALDKRKREYDGTLRVKKGKILRFFYSLPCVMLDKNPKNICQLFWGIFFGLIADYILIVTIFVFTIYVIFPFGQHLSEKATIEGSYWPVLKPFVGFVGFIGAILFFLGIFFFSVYLLTDVISSDKFMPGTKEWFKNKKEEHCSLIKLVD